MTDSRQDPRRDLRQSPQQNAEQGSPSNRHPNARPNAQPDSQASPNGAANPAVLLRSLGQQLAWLPATIAVAAIVEVDSLAGWLLIVLAAALLGGLSRLRSTLPRWLLAILLLAAVAGAALLLGVTWLLPVAYAGVVVWRSSRPPGAYPICLAGVATNGVALIAAKWAEGLAPYRYLFLVAGVVWFAAALYASHARLVDAASLRNGAAARMTARSSRLYASVLLGIVLVVFLATSDFHLWHYIADFINRLLPDSKPGAPAPSQEPVASAPPQWMPDKGDHKPGLWTKILNAAFMTVAVLIVCALLWLLLRPLLKREFYRSLKERVGAFVARLLRRRETPETPAYTDETESLLDIGKLLRQARTRWKRRTDAKPLSRAEWDRLPAEGKVRSLYREAVASAVAGGFERRASDTPEETLGRLGSWREGDAANRRSNGPGGAADWAARTRGLLASLYGKVRYGAKKPTDGELAELAREYPWGRKDR